MTSELHDKLSGIDSQLEKLTQAKHDLDHDRDRVTATANGLHALQNDYKALLEKINALLKATAEEGKKRQAELEKKLVESTNNFLDAKTALINQSQALEKASHQTVEHAQAASESIAKSGDQLRKEVDAALKSAETQLASATETLEETTKEFNNEQERSRQALAEAGRQLTDASNAFSQKAGQLETLINAKAAEIEEQHKKTQDEVKMLKGLTFGAIAGLLLVIGILLAVMARV